MLMDVEKSRQQGQAGIVDDMRSLRSESLEPVAIVGDGDDPAIAIASAAYTSRPPFIE
jgi:hypothetical protein